VQRKLAALFDQSDPDSGRASVLVAGLEDDSHEIELLLTSLLLSRSGARVAYLGVNVDRESLRCAIATSQPRLALIAPPPSGVPVDPSLQDRSGRQITVALASDGASAPGDRVLMVGRDPIAAFARVSELLSTRR
jgi:hypothetical protein